MTATDMNVRGISDEALTQQSGHRPLQSVRNSTRPGLRLSTTGMASDKSDIPSRKKDLI